MKHFVPTWSSRLHKFCRDGLTSDKEANVVFLLQSSLQKPLMSRRVSLWACKASFKFVCKVFVYKFEWKLTVRGLLCIEAAKA